MSDALFVSGVVILGTNLLYFAWIAVRMYEEAKKLRSQVQSKAESSGDSQGSQEGRKDQSAQS